MIYQDIGNGEDCLVVEVKPLPHGGGAGRGGRCQFVSQSLAKDPLGLSQVCAPATTQPPTDRTVNR